MNVSRRFHINTKRKEKTLVIISRCDYNPLRIVGKGEEGGLKEVLMVFSGKRRGGGEREAVEEEEEMDRFKPLHNFDLPCLKWGNQKLLRCMKVGSKGEVSAVDRKQSSESGGGESGGRSGGIGTRRKEIQLERRFRSSDDRKVDGYYKFSSSENLMARIGDGEIKATREKLMFDFQTEVGKMKDAILRGSFVAPTPSATATATTSTSPAERPWNLRTRRAACKAPSLSNGVNGNGDIPKPNVSPVRNECNKSSRHRPVGGSSTANATTPVTTTTSGEKRDRPKFSVSLSRRELEDDFMAMAAGRRLPRKPKKRPRVIQKQLDTLFPGLWLTEITADLYRVPDDTETGKR